MRQETSDLLRPTAGHRGLGQPRRTFVSHVHDGEAAEVLRGLDIRPSENSGVPVVASTVKHRGGDVQASGEEENPGSVQLRTAGARADMADAKISVGRSCDHDVPCR